MSSWKTAPGSSPGLLTIKGDLTLEAESLLVMEFTGTDAGSFDQLAIAGTFTAGGTLFLDVSFTAAHGETFTIFTTDGTSGRGFDAGSFNIDTNLSDGLFWDVSNLATSSVITNVPGPNTWALFAGGALLLVILPRSRCRIFPS